MIRVVLVGTGFPDWSQALGPSAGVWRKLGQVAQVDQVAAPAPLESLPPAPPNSQTVLLPLLERDVLACIQMQADGCRALLPTEQALRILADKKTFAEYLTRIGLGQCQPQVYSSPETMRFPLALKRTNLYAGNGVYRVQSQEAFQQYLQHADFSGQRYVATEWIDGDREYVTHCVVSGGTIVSHYSFEYQLASGQHVRQGTLGTRSRPAAFPASLIQTLQACLRPLGYSGICNVDFKIAPDGRIKILEINPRMGGSLMLPPYQSQLAGCLGTYLRLASS